MEHLNEIAAAVMPAVRRAALQADRGGDLLRALALRCERLVAARSAALAAEREAMRRSRRSSGSAPPGAEGVPDFEEDGAEARPDTPLPADAREWLGADDARALEFLADALGEEPELIPQIVREAAPAGFYPPFLTYLLETAVEAAQPAFRPRSFADGVWWWVWSWFAASEYASQLRERHTLVAQELARTSSWRTADPGPAPGGRTSGGAGTGDDDGTRRPFTASMFGGGQLRESVKTAVNDAVDAMRGAWAGEDSSAHRLVQALGSDGPVRRDFLAALRDELLRAPRLVRRLAEVAAAAVPFDVAFDVELLEVRASRTVRSGAETEETRVRNPERLAADLDLFGVALSGGGIRSATFNLGVLQGLAGHQLLRHVDYISSVSGGGYVGAWLASWIKRTGRRPSGRGVQVIEDRLRTEPVATPSAEGVRALRFLREYSNYLTPRAGFFSADTWTMLAIWTRNTLLNQMVLVLTLAAALMLPWTVFLGLLWFHPHASAPSPAVAPAGLVSTAPALMAAVTALLLLASGTAGQQLRRFNLPPERRASVAHEMLGQGGVLASIVLPVVVAAWLLGVVMCGALPYVHSAGFRARAVQELTVIFAAGLLVVAARGRYWRCFLADRVASKLTPGVYVRAAVWGSIIIGLAVGVAAFTGASILVGVAALAARLDPADGALPTELHVAALGVPVTIAAMSAIVVLKLGILGRNLFDEHREWWSRLGAWLNIVGLVWLGISVISLYSPSLVHLVNSQLRAFIAGSGGVLWAAWTAAGVLLGKSDKGPDAGAPFRSGPLRRVLVTLAPYVFIAGLLVIIATGAFWLVIGAHPARGQEFVDAQHWMGWGRGWHWLVAGPFGLAALAFLLSCRVDVNEFSMHHFYKNRLVRCYLGAARDEPSDPSRRSPDPFTGFDAADDLSLADLQLRVGRLDAALRSAKRQKNPRDLEPYVGPIPIVNTALNLVTGDDLAWQERKARSFTFTPFYSGYDFRSPRGGGTERFAPYGYRPTLLYGYPPFGIGLGTSIAISGAAASPNMGHHSSPAAAFLMTMFNARLGWWMGNPRDKHNWLRSGPRRGLLYLINELFGLTNDRTHFVNLSDGGHFENLGIYELVRRRCRYIVACDAEQDESLTFNGLGNAIRKCRVDLGAEITVRATRIQPPVGAGVSSLHCVVGDIAYANGEKGTLLYLKASLTGDEPADVLEYKARQPAFPHHSTMTDQFFDESQFESYRKLGVHVAQVAFTVPNSQGASVAERFASLRDYWYPAASATDRAGHVAQYEALLDRIRSAPALAFIDGAFFDPAAANRHERQELFVGASMLDLMQRVFIDLDLENDGDHPHNAGWMAIFAKWMQQEPVRRAWDASRDSYGRRFQRFVDGLR